MCVRELFDSWLPMAPQFMNGDFSAQRKLSFACLDVGVLLEHRKEYGVIPSDGGFDFYLFSVILIELGILTQLLELHVDLFTIQK